MSNTQILSPKVSIDEALLFLGMSYMEKAMGVQAVLRISELDALPLFFDERLICVPTSVKYGDEHDGDGGVIECHLIDSKDEREFWSEHILDSFHFYKSTDNTLCLLVSRIIHDDVSYHISQSDGTISEGVSIGYEKFYFDREQLFEYKADYSSHFSEIQKVKDIPSKPASVLEQRITAFKYWLVGNSGKSIHKPDDLQSCYESLGNPTRMEVWLQLHQMDSKLFSAGKDDFIKAIAKVINFKIGTGKDRNR